MGPGGTEVWLLGLLRFLDPKRVNVLRCIVTMPELYNEDFARQVPVPIEIGQAESVRRAARECDVMIFWAHPEMAIWLDGVRPPVCIYVAHGESQWTREVLLANRSVVDHAVAVSRRAQERVCDGIPSTIIHNGIDMSRLARMRDRAEVRAALGFGPEDFVVGYLGRLSPEKRPQGVIEAVAQLPRPSSAPGGLWGDAWCADRSGQHTHPRPLRLRQFE